MNAIQCFVERPQEPQVHVRAVTVVRFSDMHALYLELVTYIGHYGVRVATSLSQLAFKKVASKSTKANSHKRPHGIS